MRLAAVALTSVMYVPRVLRTISSTRYEVKLLYECASIRAVWWFLCTNKNSACRAQLEHFRATQRPSAQLERRLSVRAQLVGSAQDGSKWSPQLRGPAQLRSRAQLSFRATRLLRNSHRHLPQLRILRATCRYRSVLFA